MCIPSDILLTGADGLAPGDIAISEGRIAQTASSGPRRIDLRGLVLLPGIVDLHGDGFERHLAPRRGAVADLGAGMRATERELAANGITTAYLAQFWSWEGGMRGPDFARRLIGALQGFAAQIDLRLQLRIELGCAADFDAIAELIIAHGIGYAVLNDHLPHKALAAGKRVPRLEGQALKSGRSPQAHQALLESLYFGLPDARATLPGFAHRLRQAGCVLGSHDDPDPKARGVYREMGFEIAEFPLTFDTAAAAHAAGDRIVLGAPNVLRGGSHKRGGISARDILEAGQCQALASDYHYPSLHLAAAKLFAEGWPLERAWHLVSNGPAQALGLMDRGRISPGQRADLIVASRDLTVIHGTFAAGRLVYADGVMAERLLPCVSRVCPC